MLKMGLEQLIAGNNLSRCEMQKIVMHLLTEELNPYQTSAFLALLRTKPETVEEIIGMVEAMRHVMLKLEVPKYIKILDIVGTGGDKAKTVNISTAASILAASCGVKIIKHGNRSVSSLCGSADVLEALGVNTQLTPDQIVKSIEELGISFCFAPLFHPALIKLRELRTSLGMITTFNLIAPLLNPAKPAHVLLGVCEEKLIDVLAEVLFQLGTERSLIFHGNGLDEISCMGPIRAIEITAHSKKSILINPQEFGFNVCTLSDLQGGDALHNAALLRSVFYGETGPLADTIVLNAAVAMWIYGLHGSIDEAILEAKAHLKDGRAKGLLEEWIRISSLPLGISSLPRSATSSRHGMPGSST